MDKTFIVPVYVSVVGEDGESHWSKLRDFTTKAVDWVEAQANVYDAARALGIDRKNICIVDREVQPA